MRFKTLEDCKTQDEKIDMINDSTRRELSILYNHLLEPAFSNLFLELEHNLPHFFKQSTEFITGKKDFDFTKDKLSSALRAALDLSDLIREKAINDFKKVISEKENNEENA